MSKHYIRLDGEKIIWAFSDAFEKPIEGDICINEEGGRHYNLQIFDDFGRYNYELAYGEVVGRSDEEKDKDPEYIALLEREFKNQVRKLLQESDYTQIPDVPVTDEDRIKWKNWRAQLRNLEFGDEIPPAPNYVFDEEGNLIEIVPEPWWKFWK